MLSEVIYGGLTHHIHVGDAFASIASMPDACVNMAVTSPPYPKQRCYSEALQIGQEPKTDCLAWARGEPPCSSRPPAGCYVCSLRLVFGQLRRVLHPAGVFWLNLGDKFFRKSLQMAPASVALALRADGWLLRSEIVWSKTNPQCGSQKDRPTTSHEMIYLFSKTNSYHYDLESCRAPCAPSTIARDRCTRVTGGKDGAYAVVHDHETPSNPAGRNLWSVWSDLSKHSLHWQFCTGCKKVYSPQEFRAILRVGGKRACPCGGLWESGFSHFPPSLPIRCLKLGCPSSVCPVCFSPSCSCGKPQIPGLALDPFSGTGTTILAARHLGLRAIGLELNPNFAALSIARVAAGMPKCPKPRSKSVQP